MSLATDTAAHLPKALLPFVLAAFALLAIGSAQADARMRVVAKVSPAEPAGVRVVARTSLVAKRVLFYVDGRRQNIRRSVNWKHGRTGLLRTRRLQPGRHRLTAKAVHRHGRISRATRVIRIGRRATRSSNGRATIGLGDAQRLNRGARRAASAETDVDASKLLVDAGFEDGLAGWNVAGVGDVIPTVDDDMARTGSSSARVVLDGSQGRSELILGGDGTDDHDGSAWVFEGDEYFYAFSFNVRAMVYCEPVMAHNLIMQLKSDGTGSPYFGLQLCDGDDGDRGLWAHGAAMGGDGFLRPIEHNRWYDVVIHFKASRTGAGFYRVYLDGALIDARDGVSIIRPDRSYAYIKSGLYRNSDRIPGHSEIRLDSARLGTSMSEVVPG